jgi:hypothetical protein
MSTRIAFVADIHLYSSSLGVSGRAYELRSGSDQKCLAESAAVTDAAFELIKKSGAKAVAVVGDVTNDGEMCSHSEIVEKLTALDRSVPVYPITSTHDWCSDNNPRRYDGENVYNDVETAGKEKLNEMYLPFGKEKEISSFKTKIGFFSRVFSVAHGVRLMMINDDCDGLNGKSGYSEEHIAWVKTEAEKAKNAGDIIIAAEHHLALPCISPLVNSSQRISDGEKIADIMADCGIRLLLVGHSHMMRATEHVSPYGNKITQFNLSALCGYPAAITYADIDTESGTVKITNEYINEFIYNGKNYGREYFAEHATNIVTNILNGALKDKKEFADRLGAMGIKFSPNDKQYKLVKKGVGFLTNVKVGRAAHIINTLVPGAGYPKSMTANIKNDNLLGYILPVFLSVFDGGEAMKGVPDEVREIVKHTGRVAATSVHRLPIPKKKKSKIESIVEKVGDTLNELAEPRCTLTPTAVYKK